MSKNTWWNIGKNAFKVIVTLAAFYWLSRNISLAELKSTLLSSNPFYLFLALLTYAVSQVIASSRLNSYFKAMSLRLTERYNLRLYQLGLLYNFFLPGGVGGDAYKVYFLKKTLGFPRRKVLSAVLFDRISGLWAMGIIVGLLVIFMPRLAIPNVVTTAAMILGTAGYYYVLYLFFKQFTTRFVRIHIKALAVQGLQALAAVLILYAMGFDGKFSPYILIFMVSSLVAIVPSILGGLGLRESVLAFGATYFQIDPHIAVLIGLVFYCISLMVASSGVYYIFRPQRLGADKLPSPKEVEEEIEEENTPEEP